MFQLKIYLTYYNVDDMSWLNAQYPAVGTSKSSTTARKAKPRWFSGVW